MKIFPKFFSKSIEEKKQINELRELVLIAEEERKSAFKRLIEILDCAADASDAALKKLTEPEKKHALANKR